jgi:hypothetical protein
MPFNSATDLAFEVYDESGSDPETKRVVIDEFQRAFRRERSGGAAFEKAVDVFAARFPYCSRSVAYRRVAEIIC